VFVGHLAATNYERYGVFSLFCGVLVLALAAILYFPLVERASLRFKRLSPRMVSIYDPYFWRHERHWKLSDSLLMGVLAGTPFKNLISRLAGVKIGRKVFDGGCSITDRTLTQIDDYANLNEGSVLQAHSLEEGVFKSDHIRIGAGSTLGPGAFVHYGVNMGRHVVLDADSFLMKGEILDASTHWCGNPARFLREKSTVGPKAASDLLLSSPLEAFIPRIAAE
jgi:non-ribosomal peptide synthetase-like protein